MSQGIQFFSEHPDLQYFKPDSSSWLSSCVEEEGFEIEYVNIVLVTDGQLLELNKEYLDHDTFTDIITFDYSEDNTLQGELYISYDRAKENADEFGESLDRELHRLFIHGLLHMMHYNDKTDDERVAMRQKEDYYLNLRPFVSRETN